MEQTLQAPKINHHGRLDLGFRYKNGRTRLIECFQQPPLKASRGLHLDNDGKVTTYIMESSGGMVSGDSNHYHIGLQPHSDVRMIQQSATKIYPSHDNLLSEQSISVRLDEGARLEWCPESIIPYESARFHGNTTIEMAEDATLIWGEIISPGREKRGESFDYEAFRSSFNIWVGQQYLANDTLHLQPQAMPLDRVGILEGESYIGSVWFISPEAASINVGELHEELNQSKHLNASVTSLEGKGIHMRCLSPQLWTLQREINKVWDEFC